MSISFSIHSGRGSGTSDVIYFFLNQLVTRCVDSHKVIRQKLAFETFCHFSDDETYLNSKIITQKFS